MSGNERWNQAAIEAVADALTESTGYPLDCYLTEVEDALLVLPNAQSEKRHVAVDSSWADTLPPCVRCGHDVPWEQALLMPCSRVEDGDVDNAGIIHREGCPS